MDVTANTANLSHDKRTNLTLSKSSDYVMKVLSRKRGCDITILVLSVIWNKYYSYTVSFSQVLAPTPHIEP